MKSIMRIVILALMLVITISSVSAVSISGDVVITSGDGSSQYFNDLNTDTSNIVVGDNSVNLSGMNYTNGELNVSVNHTLWIDSLTGFINTSQFPYLSFSDNYTKNVSMFYNRSLNATLTFNTANCTDINYFDFLPNFFSSFFRIDTLNIGCSSNRATSFFSFIEPTPQSPEGNIIRIAYGLLSNWKFAVIVGLLGSISLMVYMGIKIKDEHQPIADLLWLTAILLILVLVFITTKMDESVTTSLEPVSLVIYIGYVFILLAVSFMYIVWFIKWVFEILRKPKGKINNEK